MRLGVLFVAALAALAVPSVAAARPTEAHDRDSARSARIVGTWNVQVTPTGAPAFAALLTLTPGGGVIETESDQPGTALGAWKPISRNRFAIAFQTFIFTPAGPGGHVVVADQRPDLELHSEWHEINGAENTRRAGPAGRRTAGAAARGRRGRIAERRRKGHGHRDLAADLDLRHLA